MKRIVLRAALACGLTLGIGFGAPVSAYDPDCISVCQELLRDCIAQAFGSTSHCFRAYRECLEGCRF